MPQQSIAYILTLQIKKRSKNFLSGHSLRQACCLILIPDLIGEGMALLSYYMPVSSKRSNTLLASLSAFSSFDITVSATTGFIPIDLIASASKASFSSITISSKKSPYSLAICADETSSPKPLISLSAGPFKGAPPTRGLIAITFACVLLSASLIPFTCNIGPILIMGLLGQTMILLAPSIA